MNSADAGEQVARRYLVSGRVQGVGFRWFVRERARALGVSGRVRNRADGGVLVDVVGTADLVGQLEHTLHRGPRGAQVSAVVILLQGREALAAMNALPHPFAIDVDE